MEFWEKIESGDVLYFVSTFGRVWSSNHGIIKTPLNNARYPHFNRRINGVSKRTLVHRMMAIAFLPNPENKPTVNHKNGIRSDNRIENLEWATSSEQNQHSVTVLGRKGALNKHRRKTIFAFNDISGDNHNCIGIRELARKLNIPYQAIQTGIKKPNRRYFGWRFEVISDPGWNPKNKL